MRDARPANTPAGPALGSTPLTVPTPAPRVAGCPPYAPPRPRGPIDLRLDGNEGAAPPAGLLDVLVAAGPELLRRYPSVASLEAALCERFRRPPGGVLVTAGADDALYRACLAVLAPGREIVLPLPTFEMLPRYVQLAGATLRGVPWPNGRYPTDAVCAAVTPQTAMIVVVSPNNPTGCVAMSDDLRRLADHAPHAVLLVDLAYVEFADEDLTAAALGLPNAIVTRTFSKAWGLAGLRVGYALGPSWMLDWLRAAGNPYAVASASAALAAAWLERGAAAVADFVAAVRSERAELAERLRRRGLNVAESQGNFVFVRTPQALAVRDALAARGIAVRAFPDRPDLADALRITCPGRPPALARLIAALDEVL